MYTVTVRLIFSIDSWNALAIVGIAGKYILAVNGLDEGHERLESELNILLVA